MLNRDKESFESLIREELHQAAENVRPSEFCRQQIKAELELLRNNKKRRGVYGMKKLHKVIAVVAACMVLGGMGVYASGVITGSIAVSHSGYDYTKYSDLEKAEKKIGYEVKAPESFSNGFEFDGITVVSIADTDDDGNKYNQGKGLDINYVNKDGESMLLFVEPGKGENERYQEKRDVNNVSLYFSKIENLFVPADYKPTAEEQQRSENDQFFNIGYGSDKKETEFSNNLQFEVNGINYLLVSDNLYSDDMFAMAEEIVK